MFLRVVRLMIAGGTQEADSPDPKDPSAAPLCYYALMSLANTHSLFMTLKGIVDTTNGGA